MPKKTIVPLLITATIATVSLAFLRAASPQDGAGPTAKSERSKGAFPPPGFGPGMLLAPRIIELADANGDGKLAPDEAAKAAEMFTGGADEEEKGSLDAAAPN